MAGIWYRCRSYSDPAHTFFFEAPGAPDTHGNFRWNSAAAQVMAPWWLADGMTNKDLGYPPMRLEVFNTTETPGLSLNLTRSLRNSSSDFDVIYFGNAATTTPYASFLVAHQADLRLAKAVLVRLNKEAGLNLTHCVAPARNQAVHFSILLGANAEAARFNKESFLERL